MFKSHYKYIIIYIYITILKIKITWHNVVTIQHCVMLQYSQESSPNLSKNRCRIKITIIEWEFEMNIQPISQCYAGWLLLLAYYSANMKKYNITYSFFSDFLYLEVSTHLKNTTGSKTVSTLNFAYRVVRSDGICWAHINYSSLRSTVFRARFCKQSSTKKIIRALYRATVITHLFRALCRATVNTQWPDAWNINSMTGSYIDIE